MIEISLLKWEDEKNYTNMLHNCREAMFYHSIPFRNLLGNFLSCLSCKSYYIIAKEDDMVVGAIPTFLKINRHGNILNSLPFFGSNGGFLVDSRLNNSKKTVIKKELLKEFINFANEKNCIFSTIITSPFDSDFSFYEKNIQYKFKDSRLAQITEFRNNVNDIENEIMYNIIEKRNRAAIRRPIKNNIMVKYSDDFGELYNMHNENISIKGGIVKPKLFFQDIQKWYGKQEYELLYAKKGEKIIAGLLLFYFKDTVEYFTPVLYFDYRKEQAISLLIFEGMKNALKNGYKYWNWGGTWESQESLYKFKKGWGAKDYHYYYYTIQHGDIDKILELSPEDLLREYQWFYVLPFAELERCMK
ncbi:peptidoglycan bridge formation glycyltransferase FemA/FemB family protein [candidate division WOR-3 bacterium]|nr:peptidoglycan bridge formation glycyltransferase FemA/FemB family protein [candidate division WOR-3 bacterium]